ncbi:MAG TPA: hypothetical protein VFC07_03290 [Verrucomicrobiae bacterium]|nr:hypothetical protein [Verrucomicrobiae bacterium]
MFFAVDLFFDWNLAWRDNRSHQVKFILLLLSFYFSRPKSAAFERPCARAQDGMRMMVHDEMRYTGFENPIHE